MTVPWELKLTRHGGDLDDDGHDIYNSGVLGRGVLTVGDITTVTDDTKYNAWPSLARMSDGRIFMLYTKADSHHADNTGKAVAKIGTEYLGGYIVWGTEFTVYDDPSVWVSGTGVTVLSTGRILVSGFYGAYASNPLDGAFVIYSDDQGTTWSSIVVVNSTLTSYSYGSGRALELANGDLLQPVEGKNSGDTFSRMVVLKSTDHGATWGSQVTIATGTRNYYECCLLLLDNGTILAMLRTSDASGDIYQSTSTDSGATWSTPTLAFAGHGQPNLIQMSVTGTLICTTRENLGSGTGGVWAYTSTDRATTWSDAIEVDLTPYEMEYASPLELLDGRILVAYGYQPGSAITNADIKQVYLTEGSVPVPPSSDSGGSGTVTSIALTVPAEFSIAGSPVTTSGTLAITKATETANTVWAGPTSGSAAQPAFRALVAADIPTLASSGVTDHEHIVNVVFSGDASATVWELPAAPVDASSIAVYVAGSRSVAWVLSGTLLTTLTFDSAPASAANNIVIDIVAATA